MLSSGSACNTPMGVGAASFESRASRPRPRPLNLAMELLLLSRVLRLLAPEHLAGKGQVGERAFRGLVEVQRGDAVTRRLREAHVSRNDRPVKLVAKMFLQIGGD